MFVRVNLLKGIILKWDIMYRELHTTAYVPYLVTIIIKFQFSIKQSSRDKTMVVDLTTVHSSNYNQWFSLSLTAHHAFYRLKFSLLKLLNSVDSILINRDQLIVCRLNSAYRVFGTQDPWDCHSSWPVSVWSVSQAPSYEPCAGEPLDYSVHSCRRRDEIFTMAAGKI